LVSTTGSSGSWEKICRSNHKPGLYLYSNSQTKALALALPRLEWPMQRILVLNIYAARRYLSVLCVARQTPSSGLQTGEECCAVLGLGWRRCCEDRMVRSCGESGTSWIGALQSWFCWSTTGLRYKMPAYGLRTCAYARVQVHRMGKGADASYMHPAASKIRKFMHNSLGVSTLGPCKYGSTVVVTATVVQMKAFHYSDVLLLLLHLFFFPPVHARPGQLDMIRPYQIQRRLLP
jgi:hypothetical protein